MPINDENEAKKEMTCQGETRLLQARAEHSKQTECNLLFNTV